MSAPLTAFPSFHDLKKKVAHEGGFSDGGVLCISQTLTTQGIDIAPIAGTALGGFDTPTDEDPALAGYNASGLVMNFDPVNQVNVEVHMVFADGSTFLLITFPVPPGAILPMPSFGVIVTHPNKLRLKIGAPMAPAVLPTRRVLFKASFVEYDKPADLDAT